MGLLVGDSLGVHVEFQSRAELTANPVVSMREYGSHHQSKGTWSANSSMTLCLLESFSHGLDFTNIFARFLRWAEDGYMTTHGEMFDIRRTTLTALRKFAQKTPVLECGQDGEAEIFSSGYVIDTLKLRYGVYSRQKPIPIVF